MKKLGLRPHNRPGRRLLLDEGQLNSVAGRELAAKEAGRELGCSPATVYRGLRRQGLSQKDLRPTDQQIRDAHASNLSIRAGAEEVHYSPASFHGRLERLGLEAHLGSGRPPKVSDGQIQEALKASPDKKEAAKALDISTSRLYARLRELNQAQKARFLAKVAMQFNALLSQLAHGGRKGQA